MPDILTCERYLLGIAVIQITLEAGTVAGFAFGGLTVAVLWVRVALLADAATFAVSALLVRTRIHRRPAAARPAARSHSQLAEMASGVRLVFGDRTLRTLMLLGWLVAFYVTPMGLAAPYVASLCSSLPVPVATGLIFAAGPFGTAIGAVVTGRLIKQALRWRLMGLMAVGSCCLLLLCWLHLDLIAALLVIAGSGGMRLLPAGAQRRLRGCGAPQRRGQAVGLANGGMQVTQGLWIVLTGAAASSGRDHACRCSCHQRRPRGHHCLRAGNHLEPWPDAAPGCNDPSARVMPATAAGQTMGMSSQACSAALPTVSASSVSTCARKVSSFSLTAELCSA